MERTGDVARRGRVGHAPEGVIAALEPLDVGAIAPEAGPSHTADPEAGPSHAPEGSEAGLSCPEAGASHTEACPPHAAPEVGPCDTEATEAGLSHTEAGPSRPEAGPWEEGEWLQFPGGRRVELPAGGDVRGWRRGLVCRRWIVCGGWLEPFVGGELEPLDVGAIDA